MKKMIFIFVLVLLLLCGCTLVQTPEETPKEDVPIVNGLEKSDLTLEDILNKN